MSPSSSFLLLGFIPPLTPPTSAGCQGVHNERLNFQDPLKAQPLFTVLWRYSNWIGLLQDNSSFTWINSLLIFSCYYIEAYSFWVISNVALSRKLLCEMSANASVIFSKPQLKPHHPRPMAESHRPLLPPGLTDPLNRTSRAPVLPGQTRPWPLTRPICNWARCGSSRLDSDWLPPRDRQPGAQT